MFSSFLMFLAGAVTYRLIQFFLSITANFNIYKQVEFTCLKILAEVYLQYNTSMKITKACYDSSDKPEEYAEVEKELNKRYKLLITNCIEIMKSNLPYSVKYDNILDGLKTFVVKGEEDDK